MGAAMVLTEQRRHIGTGCAAGGERGAPTRRRAEGLVFSVLLHLACGGALLAASAEPGPPPAAAALVIAVTLSRALPEPPPPVGLDQPAPPVSAPPSADPAPILSEPPPLVETPIPPEPPPHPKIIADAPAPLPLPPPPPVRAETSRVEVAAQAPPPKPAPPIRPAARAPPPASTRPAVAAPPAMAAPPAVAVPPAPPAVAVPPVPPVVVLEPRFRETPRPPVYPPASVEFEEQGEAIIRALLDRAGNPREVRVWRSSGFSRLDRAAVTAVGGWRFQPAIQNGQPIEAWVQVPVRFNLRG